MKLPTKQELESLSKEKYWDPGEQKAYLEGAQHVIDLIMKGEPDGFTTENEMFRFQHSGASHLHISTMNYPDHAFPVCIIELPHKEEEK